MRLPSPRESNILWTGAGRASCGGLKKVLEKHHAVAHPAKNTGAAARHQAVKETVSANISFQIATISVNIFGNKRGEYAGAMGGVGGNPPTQNDLVGGIDRHGA